MIELQIFDSAGVELKVGDLVLLQNNSHLTFYTRVQIRDGSLYPFCSFAFDRCFKVKEIPVGNVHHPEPPEYWVHPNVERAYIEKGGEWAMDVAMFEHNKFYKVK